MRISMQRLTRIVGNVLLVGSAALVGCDTATMPSPDPVVAESVTVAPESVALESLGQETTLTALARDANGAVIPDAVVQWVSRDPAIASVSPVGVVTAIGNGSTTILASVDGVTDSAMVDVAQALDSIALSPATHTFASLGDTLTLTVTAYDALGGAMEVPPLTWVSEDPAVVTVEDGKLVAVSAGETTVIAVAESVAATMSVTVSPVPARIAISETDLQFASLGEAQQLFAVALDAGGSTIPGAALAWTSQNPAVATVTDQGLVSAQGNGSTTVTVSLGDLSATATVVVQQVPAQLLLTPGSQTLAVGNSVDFDAVVVDARGNPIASATIAWSSSTPTVASVNQNGLVAALNAGLATIEARSGGLSASAQITVPTPPPAGVFGRLAIIDTSGLVLVDVDGTNRQVTGYRPPSVRELSVDWSRDGRRIVVGGVSGAEVYDIASGSVVTTSWVGGSDVIWPRFNPAGDSIYYSAYAGPGNDWDVRRAPIDGSGVDILIPSSQSPHNDFMPAVSPTGNALVYTADWEQVNFFLLRVLDFSSGTTATINLEGVVPVWSPDGSRIGYQELGRVGSVAPDGTDKREYNPGWGKGVTFSPDGRWMVGIVGGYVEVIDVFTGQVHRLDHLGSSNGAVAWKP